MIEIISENILNFEKNIILEAAIESILFHDTIDEVYDHMTTELMDARNNNLQFICTLSEVEIDYKTVEKHIYFKIEKIYFFVLVIKE